MCVKQYHIRIRYLLSPAVAFGTPFAQVEGPTQGEGREEPGPKPYFKETFIFVSFGHLGAPDWTSPTFSPAQVGSYTTRTGARDSRIEGWPKRQGCCCFKQQQPKEGCGRKEKDHLIEPPLNIICRSLMSPTHLEERQLPFASSQQSAVAHDALVIQLVLLPCFYLCRILQCCLRREPGQDALEWDPCGQADD